MASPPPAAPSTVSAMQLRVAGPQDWAFVVEMARDACTLEQRPRPAADAPAVVALLPGPQDVAVIAADNHGRSLGAAWLHTHQPPLLSDAHGRALPELVMAVLEKERGKGIGAALVDALAAHAASDSARSRSTCTYAIRRSVCTRAAASGSLAPGVATWAWR